MARAVLDALKKRFGDAVLETESHCGDETAVVAAARLVEIADWLRTDEAMAFDLVSFVTCIDRLGQSGFDVDDGETPRFEVVYSLRSIRHRHRVRLKVKLAESKLEVPTLSHLWPAFNWLERECFDMYGIEFVGHPDLRRIYMYEEFVGHPLRKDYPKERRQPLVRREWTDEVTNFTTGDRPEGS